MSDAPWPERFIATLPNRPLTKEELNVLHGLDGPADFSTYLTTFTPALEWQEYGFVATVDGVTYGFVFEDAELTEGDTTGWIVLTRGDREAVFAELEAWAHELAAVSDMIGAPVRFGGATG